MIVGEQALPIATLFGVVRCSGVIGCDEKWVGVRALGVTLPLLEAQTTLFPRQ
jgi:hypothetical protein